MSVTPQEALSDLQAARDELRQLSDALFSVSVLLDGDGSEANPGAEKEYQEFIDDHEVGLWTQSQESGTKLPSQAMMTKLARREMPADLLARYDRLRRKRERIKQRIADVAKIAEACRSILSAVKEEARGAGVS